MLSFYVGCFERNFGKFSPLSAFILLDCLTYATARRGCRLTLLRFAVGVDSVVRRLGQTRYPQTAGASSICLLSGYLVLIYGTCMCVYFFLDACRPSFSCPCYWHPLHCRL
ncbi:unnamed protein product [Ectocarpus sp. 12 AP-2014]